jgi:acetate kinase
MSKNILVINCGSSSLKYRIIRMPEELEIAGGEAVRVGTRTSEPSAINYHFGKGYKKTVTELPDHKTAFLKIIELIDAAGKDNPGITYDCFAHRYVHPGTFFKKPAEIGKKTISALQKTLSLAPIHNVISLNLIRLCAKEFKKTPQYAVFDTSFHKTIPKELGSYALPEALVKKYNLKKAGFHGISHRYVMEEACRFLGRDPSTQKIVSCHLGSGGSSVCAIKNGKSINNTMGFTPLEGLMMNTRSGDIDIGLLLSIIEKNNLSPEQVENVLNYKSGILGIFAGSSDMRDVAKNVLNDEKAKMAFDIYTGRVKKYIGYYCLLLHQPDILIFTDTLGIEMSALRQNICAGMDCFGIKLDVDKNAAYKEGNSELSGSGSQAKIVAIPTNEEVMIARETYTEIRHDDRS